MQTLNRGVCGADADDPATKPNLLLSGYTHTTNQKLEIIQHARYIGGRSKKFRPAPAFCAPTFKLVQAPLVINSVLRQACMH